QALTVVLPCLAARVGALTLLSQAFGSAIAVIRAAFGYERRGRRTVLIVPLRLKVRRVWPPDSGAFIPVEAEPLHSVEDAGDHVGRRSFGVRILDAKNEGTAMTPREQPVEKGGASTPHVE